MKLSDMAGQLRKRLDESVSSIGSGLNAYANAYQKVSSFIPLAPQVPTTAQVKQTGSNLQKLNEYVAKPLVTNTYNSAKPIINYLDPSGYDAERKNPSLGNQKFFNAVKATPITTLNLWGLSRVTPMTTAISGAFGGAINKATGGSFGEGFKSGVQATPIISGIGAVSNPLISGLSSKVASQYTNPITSNVIGRVVSGVGNIPEGIAMRKAMGINSYTPLDAAMDFGTGVLLQPPTGKLTVKGARSTIDPYTLNEVDTYRDVLNNAIKAKDKTAYKQVVEDVDRIASKWLSKEEIQSVIDKSKGKQEAVYYRSLLDNIANRVGEYNNRYKGFMLGIADNTGKQTVDTNPNYTPITVKNGKVTKASTDEILANLVRSANKRSDSAINARGKMLVNKLQALTEEKRAVDLQNEVIKSQTAQLTKQDIQDIGILKRFKASKLGQEGDIETFLKKYPEVYNRITDTMRRVTNDYTNGTNLTDEELLNQALSLNTQRIPLRRGVLEEIRDINKKLEATLAKQKEKYLYQQTGAQAEREMAQADNRLFKGLGNTMTPEEYKQWRFDQEMNMADSSLNKKYRVKPATPDQIERVYNDPNIGLTPDGTPTFLVDGVQPNSKVPTEPVLELPKLKGTKDNPTEFRQIMNEFLGSRANAKLTQYETLKPISDVKLTGDSALKTIDMIQTGKTHELPPKLQQYAQYIRGEFDKVRKEAVKDGMDIGYIQNYLTQYWKQEPQVVQETINGLRKRGFFQNKREILTYKQGIEAGLTPRYESPTQILGAYVRAVENLRSNIRLIKQLENNGYVVSGQSKPLFSGYREIAVPGFENKFAKPEVAKVIEEIFNPSKVNPILGKLAWASGKLQDVTLSGGLPGTPLNAFSVNAQLQKQALSGRAWEGIKAFGKATNPAYAKQYFESNIGAIKEIQGKGYRISNTLDLGELMGEQEKQGTIKTGLSKIEKAWDMAISDPTFKRYVPILQIDFYKQVRDELVKKKVPYNEAVDKAVLALKNFEGLPDMYSQATANPNVEALKQTFLFAPRYRQAIINIWANSIKGLKDPLAIENRATTRFLAGATAAFVLYNAANMYFNGKPMWENGRGKEDKLLIPDGKGGQIGIPFLSSLATIPRALFREGLAVAQGDLKGATTDALQSYSSSLIKPIADVMANQDYYGKTIVKPDSQNKWGDIVSYLGRSYLAHPYLKELTNPSNIVDPAYQRLSRALELPFKFYDQKSINASKYYAAKDEALKGMSDQEMSAYNALPRYDKSNPDSQILKYQIFLTYPQVFEAKRMTEFNLAKDTGKPIDPLYLVNYDTAKKYMRYETLPPGSQDRKDLIKANPELGALFDVRSKYFAENPIPGQSQSNKPMPSDYVTAQMNLKNWKDPQVRAYLDANTAWQNTEREKLGLTPLVRYGYSSGQKKGRRVKITAKVGRFRAPKVKTNKVKLTSKKLKSVLKVKNPKKLKLSMLKVGV